MVQSHGTGRSGPPEKKVRGVKAIVTPLACSRVRATSIGCSTVCATPRALLPAMSRSCADGGAAGTRESAARQSAARERSKEAPRRFSVTVSTRRPCQWPAAIHL